MRLVWLLCLWPGAVLADEAMTPEGFAAFSVGKTVTYESEGRVFGREEYRAGRQVVWQAGESGLCEYGAWFEGGPGEICFDYGEGPVCWRFSNEGGQFSARPVDQPEAPPLVATAVSEAPLTCPGPEVGV